MIKKVVKVQVAKVKVLARPIVALKKAKVVAAKLKIKIATCPPMKRPILVKRLIKVKKIIVVLKQKVVAAKQKIQKVVKKLGVALVKPVIVIKKKVMIMKTKLEKIKAVVKRLQVTQAPKPVIKRAVRKFYRIKKLTARLVKRMSRVRCATRKAMIRMVAATLKIMKKAYSRDCVKIIRLKIFAYVKKAQKQKRIATIIKQKIVAVQQRIKVAPPAVKKVLVIKKKVLVNKLKVAVAKAKVAVAKAKAAKVKLVAINKVVILKKKEKALKVLIKTVPPMKKPAIRAKILKIKRIAHITKIKAKRVVKQNKIIAKRVIKVAKVAAKKVAKLKKIIKVTIRRTPAYKPFFKPSVKKPFKFVPGLIRRPLRPVRRSVCESMKVRVMMKGLRCLERKLMKKIAKVNQTIAALQAKHIKVKQL